MDSGQDGATMLDVRGVALGFLLGLLGSCDGIGFCGQKGSSEEGDGGGGTCCVRCTNSKPCGDSCIAHNKTCNAGAGCACVELDESEHDLDLVEEETTT